MENITDVIRIASKGKNLDVLEKFLHLQSMQKPNHNK
jgi:hypothetical protein